MKNKSTFINYYYSISILLLVFSFHSCKDKFECNSQNTVEIPQTLKDYFVFQEGSYWVYKNTKTNELDSMWVDGLDENKEQGGGENSGSSNNCYKWIIIGFKDINSRNISNLFFYNTGELNKFKLDLNWKSNDIESSTRFNFSNDTFTSFGNFIIPKIDTLVVQNNIFLNCIEFKSSNIDVSTWTFSKNIGLIKFNDSDSNKWEILNYKIIK